MVDNPVPFNALQPSQEDEGVPFDDPNNKPLSSEIAADRASKATYGLQGKINKTYDDYYDSFVSGQEVGMRNYIANELDTQAAERRQNIVTAITKQKGSALSAEDFDSIDRVINDPNSVIEDHHAQKVINNLNWPVGKEETNWVQNAYEQIPEQVKQDIDVGVEYRAKREFGISMAQDAESNAEKQSWPGYLVDRLKELSGLYTFIKPHMAGTSWLALPGDQREEAIHKLWTMPYDQMKKEYVNYYNTLKADNPVMAKQFASDFVGFTSQDKFLQNIFPLLSIETAPLAALGRGAIKNIELQNATRTAVRQMILNEVDTRYPELSAALAAGNVKDATVRNTVRSIINRVRRSDPIADAMEDLPNMFRLGKKQLTENDGGDLAGTQKLIDQYDSLIQQFPQMMQDLTRAERIPALAEKFRPAIEAAQDDVINNNRTLSSRIWNISEPYKEAESGNWWVDMILGKNSQESFGTKGHAGRVAAEHGLDGFEIRQGGSGYYVVKPIPVNETSPGMRQYMAKLSSDQTPTGGVLNSFLSRLRTPNETLSAWQSRNREAATFASSRIEKYAYDQAEAIRKLAPSLPFGPGKGRWDEFERILNAARDIPDPTTKPPQIGYTYRNIGELQYAYMKQLGRLPDSSEIAAYFAFKRINEMDHTLRVVSIVRNKQRHGVMAHRFYTIKDGEKVYSKEFDAIPQSHFPRGSTGDTIVIMGDEPGEETIKRIGSLGKAINKYVGQVKRGEMKVARIYAPEYTPLSGYGRVTNEHAIWVMSKNFETKPINWTTQLPWRGGGHFVPKWNQYIKQINIKKETIDGADHFYAVGVNTLMPVPNSVEGRSIIKMMEELRSLFQTTTPENLAKAKQLVGTIKNMDWKEVYQWFRPLSKRDKETGKMLPGQPPLFNLTEPFQLVRANDNLINIDKAGLEQRYARDQFTDGTKHGSLNQQFATEFTQERDANQLMTLHNDGSVEQPAYRWDPAPLLDAIPTMDRAMTKIAHTTLMDDVKLHSVETWLREAAPGLRVSDSELQSAPLYWFHHAEFTKGWDPIRASELETARLQIKQFIGQVSETDAITHTWSQRLADAVYERSPRLSKWIDPVKTAHFLQDPARVVRSLTFHLKMGLFSIPQILVQGQTYVNIFGISGPVKATQGTIAALMHQYSRIHPGAIDALDRIAGRFGWRPGEVKEARQAGIDTGFFNVGSEYSLRDDPMSNKIITTNMGKFLDLGATPFTEGERNVRYGAWYTAYKEFRDAKPTGPLSNADKLKILDRASILNGNMNRASNALYQRGWAALPTQFLTYQIRQAELIWGKRLTAMEKGRLLISNAMMYGLPVGLGISGLPSDILRRSAIENGYTPGENYFETMVTEGIPSTILALMNNGTYYNIGERFGNTGITNIYDVLYGDKTLWDMAGGAAGSTLHSAFEAFDPFRQKIMSTLRGDPGGFSITAEHYAQVAKEASSFNNTWRSIVAAQTGKLLTKKGELLSDKMDVFSSILMGLTGLQPQEATDFYLMAATMKAEKEVQEWGRKRFIEEIHRGLQAYDNKDPSNGQAFMTNAFAYMEMYSPEDEKDKWLTDASKNWETIIARNKEAFGTKHVPPYRYPTLRLGDQQKSRLQQYIQGLQH